MSRIDPPPLSLLDKPYRRDWVGVLWLANSEFWLKSLLGKRFAALDLQSGSRISVSLTSTGFHEKSSTPTLQADS